MMQQFLLGQENGQIEEARQFAELTQKLNSYSNDLNNKLESLTSKVKYMESNIASTSAPKPNQLHGPATQNTREFTAKAIHFYEEVVTEDSEVQDGEDLSLIEAQSNGSSKQTEAIKALDQKDEERGPPLGKYAQHPFLKDMLLELSKQKAQDQDMKDLKEIGKAIIPAHLEDPGSFNLPCSISYMHFNKCLCDLGASVSLMPYSVAEKLGYGDFKASNFYISLKDGSKRDVVGVIENFPVKIGKARIPTDFVIMSMDHEPEDPLILGRPFLATARAVIDVKMGTIKLHLTKDFTMKFDINNSTHQPTFEEEHFVVEKKTSCEAFEDEEDPMIISSAQAKTVEKLKGSAI
ncbi:PREDICTED: uncharacterized protein LOC104715536 [Camelina sativa]|uniref:Uncharacterized protein LOC104715536 n=1 Tax=Camelina sativa TaxID=90675 RepID=A0ABM0TTP5_CAMSA|nr:PREDICTED: uncharacterized protein LOC104715536 [Camelina sativa]